MQFFCNAKDRTSLICHFNDIYEFVFHRCSGNYDGKTENTFHERTCEHAWTDRDSVTNNHLDECDGTKHLFSLCHLTATLFSDYDSNNDIDVRSLKMILIQNNTNLIDHHKNWNIRLFKEALTIKVVQQSLSSCLKASKDLQLHTFFLRTNKFSWRLSVLHFFCF